MFEHKILKYVDYRDHGLGWWEELDEPPPVKHGLYLRKVIASLEVEGWEVAALAVIPWAGGNTQTLILKRRK